MLRFVALVLCVFLCCGYRGKSHAARQYPSLGYATWYNPRHPASGERYVKGGLTCAMRRRDFGKSYLVCNQKNHKCVVVRHNDFGPSFYLFLVGRIIDLSRDAFSKIGDLKKGILCVRIGEIYPGQADQ